MDKRASTSTNAFSIDERCTNDIALNPVSPRCRLAGYPANQISILTTYNGQKALLQDVIERRCASNPAFGRPHKVSPAFLSSFIWMFMFPFCCLSSSSAQAAPPSAACTRWWLLRVTQEPFGHPASCN